MSEEAMTTEPTNSPCAADSDVRKTAFSDIRKGAEQRRYEVHRQRLEYPSSITIYFDCPWCGNEVKAYLWSLSGSGKKCHCGAIFGSGSRCYKLPPNSVPARP